MVASHILDHENSQRLNAELQITGQRDSRADRTEGFDSSEAIVDENT
jgi:hypothetical protein